MESPNRPQNSLIKQLLRDTLTLLCKNALIFNTELRIEGLLGLTVDKTEIILISIGETVSKDGKDLSDGNCNMVEPQQLSGNQTGQAVSAHPKTKAKRPRSSRMSHVQQEPSSARSCTASGNTLETNGAAVPCDVEGATESAGMQFERIEVKEEVDFDVSCRVPDDKANTLHPFASAEQEDENDCFIESVSGGNVQNNEANSFLPNSVGGVQNDFGGFEHGVGDFLSVDQKIFQEMFQGDFGAGSLSYGGGEGFSGEGYQVSNESQMRPRTPRQRPNFPRNDGTRGRGLHRRGYKFHCRYGYSRVLHQCTQCSTTFTMASNLGRHMATMHNMNGYENNMFCPVCQKKFSRSDNLARHLKKVHKFSSLMVPSENVPSEDPVS